MRSLWLLKLRQFSDRGIMLLVRPRRDRPTVLLVRLDAIGDFVLWLDAARELRRFYQGRHVVLAANALWADLAVRMKLFDEIWPIDVSRFRHFSRYRVACMVRVRRHGFSIAVQTTFSRSQTVDDALIEASGASVRIGSTGNLNNTTPEEKEVSDRNYTRLLPATPSPLMEIERNAEFVSLLRGVEHPSAAPCIPPLGDLPARLRIGHRYLVVFPGASAGFRRWPTANFVAVADAIAAERDLTVVLCGSASDHVHCESIGSNLKAEAINLAGQTALWELVETIRGADLLVGNETSAVHIAAAVGTPAVCILGGGHYGRFAPYSIGGKPSPVLHVATHPMPCFGCNWKCTQPYRSGGPVLCISRISTEDVLARAREALSQRTIRPDPTSETP